MYIDIYIYTHKMQRGRQVDRQIGRQIGRQVDRQIDRQLINIDIVILDVV